jgi:hypothetical protein
LINEADYAAEKNRSVIDDWKKFEKSKSSPTG